MELIGTTSLGGDRVRNDEASACSGELSDVKTPSNSGKSEEKLDCSSEKPGRQIMNGKPVLYQDAATIINFKSFAFEEKQLCDGLTFNLGRACVYSCVFCYVDCAIHKLVYPVLDAANADLLGLVKKGGAHE